VTAATPVRDVLVPKARAWARVLASLGWWRLPGEDREAHRSGVELAFWTNRQVRRSGLCLPGVTDALVHGRRLCGTSGQV
jgi:hypothetical protein